VDLGRGRAPALSIALLLLAAPGAQAATVAVEGDALRLVAAPAETNQLAIAQLAPGSSITVTDSGAPLTAGPGCTSAADGSTECAAPPGAPAVARIELDAGDLDDSVRIEADLPAWILGGDGADQLVGGSGADFADGGAGDDSIDLRDGVSDSAWCGAGRDSVAAETLDALDLGCESVDSGPPGQLGRLMRVTGGGRWVPIPGQTWARVDRRILDDVLYLVRRYHVRITEGFGTVGHEPFGEHPLGLAVDIEPGPGGTWADVSRLARWAEPRQNHPRAPFRWVGWNGDFNHGHPSVCKPSRGCAPHLHLSWSHSRTAPRRVARSVWVWQVR
jgi:RTX calcium-binding nonapeptide repeat (4 copies)